MNTYVIGDVHGCYYTMCKLINKLPKNARIIFVGDLCDRGLYTKEVVEYVIENNHEVIMGNHEDFMITHIQDTLEKIDNRWYNEEYMGGKQSIESYKGDVDTLLNHIQWMKALPRYILIEKYFITHGFGLPYYKNRTKDSAIVGLLKNRISDEKDWGYDWEKGYKTYDIVNIFGHTDYEEVEVGDNYYGIDTGCCYGKKLTAIELGSMNIIQEICDKKDIGEQISPATQ